MKTFHSLLRRNTQSFMLLFFCCTSVVFAWANPLGNLSSTTSVKDTSFPDLTAKYTVMLLRVIYPENVLNLKIAVIPLNAIGKNKIDWCDSKTQMTKETEKEFETELLKCTDGKDKTVEDLATTSKKLLYCERVGYGEGAAGSLYEIHYCSFVKDKMLIVIEFTARWVNCDMFEDARGKKRCAAKKLRLITAIDRMVVNIVKTIKIKKGNMG